MSPTETAAAPPDQLARAERQLFVAEVEGVRLQHELEEAQVRLTVERAQHEETRNHWRTATADLASALERLQGAKKLLDRLRLRLRDAARQGYGAGLSAARRAPAPPNAETTAAAETFLDTMAGKEF